MVEDYIPSHPGGKMVLRNVPIPSYSMAIRASFYIYNTTDEIDRLLEIVDRAVEDLPNYLASDLYHDRIFEHYQRPNNADGLVNPTFVKSSEETTCGDEGKFR